MTIDEDTYSSSCISQLRDQLSLAAPDVAGKITFAKPRFVLSSVNVQVDFSCEPKYSSAHLEKSKPAAADLPSQQAADDLLKAEFEAVRLRLSTRPPFDRSRGLFNLSAVPKEIGEPIALTYSESCSSCAGKRITRCNKCRGQGGYTCTSCDARRDIECHECRGSGQVQDFSGSTITCRRCAGTRRLPCDRCDRTGRIVCHACKGKKTLPCKPCSALGYMRFSRSLSVLVSVSPALSQSKLNHPLLSAALDRFGGLGSLDKDLGQVVSHAIKPGCATYQLDVPFFSVTASVEGASSVCSLAGFPPRVIETGDFLESTLNHSFASLEKLVCAANSITCDPAKIRVALLVFLDSPIHRACIAPSTVPVPGITSIYASKARSLVTTSLGLVKNNTLFRFVTAGLLVAPFAYILANRMLGMQPLDAFQVALLPPAIAYFSALVSVRITLKSLSTDPEVHRLLSLSV